MGYLEYKKINREKIEQGLSGTRRTGNGGFFYNGYGVSVWKDEKDG